MKVLTLIFLLFSFNTFAQKNEIFHIDSLPTEGVLLDKGWKWQGNDTLWQAINPTLDIRDSIPEKVKKQVGKIRLYLSLNPNLKNVPLAIQIHQSVAAQYFLNGIKIAECGTLDSKPENVIAKDIHWQPIVFPLTTDSVNILEVLFAVQPNISYTTVFEAKNPLTFIRLNEANISQSLYSNMFRRYGIFVYFLIGMCLMIFVIHFSLYFLYPQNKANLYFALSRLIFSVGVLFQNTYYLYTTEFGHKYWYGSFAIILFMISNIFTLLAVTFYLNRKTDWIDKIYIVFFIPVIYALFFVYPNGWRISPIYQFVLLINLIRIAISSRKTNKKDALVIGLGSLVTFISFVLFISVGAFNSDDFVTSQMPHRVVLYFIYALALPVAISILIAREFANIALNLKKKMIENENLAAEKHHILATQNETLEKQVKERTAELVASQTQLIQKEKLASLGELTAGIAHEIQNPLNFVNNFSELSVDLAKDLKEEIHKPNIDKEYVEELLTDLSQNQEKINHHGKRASSIVKGMLEHSRASTGVKEMTDINALADEYFRLSYHGLRAKDKDFNATMETDFDKNLPKINVIPQDIGRVLLNLFNNAFYAVNERNNVETGHALSLPKYQPTVTISTQLIDNQIVIKVKDNGMGMPESVRAKVFQPFFTTKPTGSGTGLGLSLAYDIVTKGHGGALEVVSTEGVGSEFIICLLLKNNE
jgi:two-component system, NtrC family, sensor kinase